MKRILFLGSVLAVLLLFVPTSSQAITIGFDLVSQTVPVGNSADVDLVISGLGDGTAPSLGAYDLDISFDSSILSFDSVTFGSGLDIWGLGSITAFDDSTPGVVNLFEVSFDFPLDLENYQADSFILASLTFDTLSVGTSPLSISINDLSDAWGDPLTTGLQSGSISPVPEPATLFLLGAGMIGLAGLKKKKEMV